MARLFRNSQPTLIATLLLAVFCLISCSSPEPEKADNDLISVTMQTDWLAQPEYAGFYQAKAAGIYEKYGLDVTIVEGGPNADPMKRLILKRCDFVNARSDDVIVAFARGMPVQFVGVTLQHNPLAILSHAENPITEFGQLDGKRIMVNVAAPWIDYLEGKYDIQVVRMPHNFGLSHYLNDKEFVMQCFLTNEPYQVRKLGADPIVLPMWKSGWDAYRGIVVHSDSLQDRPEVVEKFVNATHEAWQSYLFGDPSPAHELIQNRNPKMTDDFMGYIRSQLIENHMVAKETAGSIGKFDPARLQEQIQILSDMKIIEKKFDYSEVFTIFASSTP